MAIEIFNIQKLRGIAGASQTPVGVCEVSHGDWPEPKNHLQNARLTQGGRIIDVNASGVCFDGLSIPPGERLIISDANLSRVTMFGVDTSLSQIIFSDCNLTGIKFDRAPVTKPEVIAGTLARAAFINSSCTLPSDITYDDINFCRIKKGERPFAAPAYPDAVITTTEEYGIRPILTVLTNRVVFATAALTGTIDKLRSLISCDYGYTESMQDHSRILAEQLGVTQDMISQTLARLDERSSSERIESVAAEIQDDWIKKLPGRRDGDRYVVPVTAPSHALVMDTLFGIKVKQRPASVATPVQEAARSELK